jgi:alcohol dehydrogenase (cytochrome c)
MTANGHDRARTSRPPAFSALTQITPANAAALKPVWTFSTGVLGVARRAAAGGREHDVRGHTVAQRLYAFDLSKDDYPLRWKYRPDVSPRAVGIACCDAVNRGAVYADGLIIYNLLDGHTVAVDATTGREKWKTQVAELDKGETITMAPLVVKDRVFVGPSGRRVRHPGLVQGARREDREDRVDRAEHRARQRPCSSAPAIFKPFYDKAPTWAPRRGAGNTWQRGGGPCGAGSRTTPSSISFIRHREPGPYNAEQRAGDNKWTSSVLARRPGDGSLVWAYQYTPADNWDYDANAELILADLTIKGQRGRCWSRSTRTGSRTRSTARPVRSSSRSRTCT